MGRDLDEQQRTAVSTAARAAIVVAGPGSGKTGVLAARCARLVSGEEPPSSILAVTFTNRAAKEMKERAGAEGAPARGLTVGTFHSVSLNFLRRHGVPVRLIGRQEQARIAGELSPGRADKTLAAISALKNGAVGRADIDPGLVDGYGRALRELGAVDLDDLVPMATALVRDEGLSPWRHIMVDEYQDINPAQSLFVRELARGAESLFVIGDPDQAIYSFRGSEVGCFLDFEKVFPGAERITLSRNYRSAGRIVRASRALIAKNTRRLDNDIEPVRPGGTIELVECADERQEAAFIICEIERLMGGLTNMSAGDDTGMRFSDFAILARTNRLAEGLAAEFALSSLPFSLVAGQPAHLLAFVEKLKTLALPEGCAAGEFVLAEARAFGLDAASLAAVESAAAASGEGASIDELADAALLSSSADCLDILADKVKIMTMHAAKGLEWRCVFIAGAEDGLIPMTRPGEDGVEEERRLFYVGVTRARDLLYITHARKRKSHGATREMKWSPFISELPPELVSTRQLEQKPRKKRPVQKGLFE